MVLPRRRRSHELQALPRTREAGAGGGAPAYDPLIWTRGLISADEAQREAELLAWRVSNMTNLLEHTAGILRETRRRLPDAKYGVSRPEIRLIDTDHIRTSSTANGPGTASIFEAIWASLSRLWRRLFAAPRHRSRG